MTTVIKITRKEQWNSRNNNGGQRAGHYHRTTTKTSRRSFWLRARTLRPELPGAAKPCSAELVENSAPEKRSLLIADTTGASATNVRKKQEYHSPGSHWGLCGIGNRRHGGDEKPQKIEKISNQCQLLTVVAQADGTRTELTRALWAVVQLGTSCTQVLLPVVQDMEKTNRYVAGNRASASSTRTWEQRDAVGNRNRVSDINHKGMGTKHRDAVFAKLESSTRTETRSKQTEGRQRTQKTLRTQIWAPTFISDIPINL